MFLRPRPERRVKSKPKYSINLSQECVDVILKGNVTRHFPGENFVPDELPDETMKFDPLHCNDVVTRETEESVDNLSEVTSLYPIGTVEIIMPSVTEGNDIPIGSIADGSNVKEESQMSTDGQ